MKTAVITGCNRGLGKAFMEAYATNGTVNVWLNSSYTNNIPSEPQNLVIYRNGDNIRLSSNFDASSESIVDNNSLSLFCNLSISSI